MRHRVLAVQLNRVPTVEELQKRVTAAVAEHKEGDWITGGGWAMEAFPGGLPSREPLDAVTGGRPAFFRSASTLPTGRVFPS